MPMVYGMVVLHAFRPAPRGVIAVLHLVAVNAGGAGRRVVQGGGKRYKKCRRSLL